MITNHVKSTLLSAVAGLLLLGPATGIAKDKSTDVPVLQNPASQDLVWLNAEEVIALFEGGFWCADPIGDTCTFTTYTLEIGQNEVTYRVSGYMDETTIISLDYEAKITDDGILCDSSELNLQSLTATHATGVPLNKAEMAPLLAVFSSGDEIASDEYVCFGFVVPNPQYPYSITQHEIDIEFNILSSVNFDISFAANAAEQYILRWD